MIKEHTQNRSQMEINLLFIFKTSKIEKAREGKNKSCSLICKIHVQKTSHT